MPLSHIQPQRYSELLAAKAARVSKLLAPHSPPPAEVYASSPLGFRLRAEFRVWHDGEALDYVMFRPGEPKNPLPITDFPIADPLIQDTMPRLMALLRTTDNLRRKLFQVEFLATLSGELLITLIYHRPLDEAWEEAARQLRHSLWPASQQNSLIGRSRRQKIVLGRDYVTETLDVEGRGYHYRQYEQSFTQPNARLNIDMLEWACARAAELPPADLLELYCGNGNFTLPLSQHFHQVIATELSKASTRAALANAAANNTDNIEIVRLSAEEVTQAMRGEREFRRLRHLPKPLADYPLKTLFVDPPRAGLDDATTAMAGRFDHILYVSCNPQTLATNLEQLCASHEITHLALFDQFPYTEHMECGVALRRRQPD